MPEIIESSVIRDVLIVKLMGYEDPRGRFMETFRKEWFPMRTWGQIQSNRSDSRANVVRGLHYHRNQVDYWYVPFGKVRAGLFDMRRNSPTFKAVQTVDMGDEDEIGLFIPIGVAHGFAALTDATLFYIVDQHYDSSDEFGVLWNDPMINMPWGITDAIVSKRDAENSTLAELAEDQLPE